jgi:hypothetical protein
MNHASKQPNIEAVALQFNQAKLGRGTSAPSKRAFAGGEVLLGKKSAPKLPGQSAKAFLPTGTAARCQMIQVRGRIVSNSATTLELPAYH